MNKLKEIYTRLVNYLKRAKIDSKGIYVETLDTHKNIKKLDIKQTQKTETCYIEQDPEKHTRKLLAVGQYSKAVTLPKEWAKETTDNVTLEREYRADGSKPIIIKNQAPAGEN